MPSPSPSPRAELAPMRQVLRVLGALVLVGFILVAFSPLPNVVAALVSAPVDPGNADAIVVLGGGGNWPRGELNPTALRRTVHGIRLYRDGRAPLLLLSGGPARERPSLAQRERLLALACAVPPDAILTADGSHTTRDEVERLSAVLRARGARSIALVTDPYHMVRARRLFERAGF